MPDKQHRTASKRPAHRRGMSAGEIRQERRQRSQRRKKARRAVVTTAALLAASALLLAFVIPVLTPLFGTSTQRPSGDGPVMQDPLAPNFIDSRNRIAHIGSSNVYTTEPATSGAYYFSPQVQIGPREVSSPANWGVYDFVLPDEVLVANLSYGGIGLHYDCPDDCPELVEQLRGVRPRTSILSPYPGLTAENNAQIAVTAWRRSLYLDEFDEARIREFISAYLNHVDSPQPIFTANPTSFGGQQ